jgi:hypothetical protein
MPELKLHFIFLRSGWLLVSKKKYPTWKQIQDEYSDYMASFGPWTVLKIFRFLEDEYPTEFGKKDADRISRFLDMNCDTLALFN